MAEKTYTALTFDQLKGWRDDNHQAAFDVFKTTCDDMDGPEWATLNDIARTGPAPRAFFEEFFRPVLIEDGNATLFTGYYEPELTGSRERGESYRYPIYTRPDDLNYSRREIEQDGVLADRGLELAWLTDPVDVFFLQVQGSGRIRLPDGSMMRVGFGGKNGRPYTSIGKLLVARGVFGPDQVSADAISDWVQANGEVGRALLLENESYVFFREVSEVLAHQGPLGTMNRSITAGRSIAVDPAFVPLGAPVWIEKDGATPMQRLVIAQDTGGAIKGAQRADIFFGTGPDAGVQAGRIKDGGRMIVLLPVQLVVS
ncbi:membrane-bound lytic murein transglycosylase A [Loktanella sp. PT4BL]|uniref:murein transglycosylase A n=1 Tax=Loktanella sp. PT4BL TaxID=2135611 RepID=UPI000D755322|nr:murein transglycosylase A [Loktanella sp. PT4BL]PXW71993.1 membrane-bound lytic murein transglycosylase A [Loktanella sp. PT4BL]